MCMMGVCCIYRFLENDEKKDYTERKREESRGDCNDAGLLMYGLTDIALVLLRYHCGVTAASAEVEYCFSACTCRTIRESNIPDRRCSDW